MGRRNKRRRHAAKRKRTRWAVRLLMGAGVCLLAFVLLMPGQALHTLGLLRGEPSQAAQPMPAPQSGGAGDDAAQAGPGGGENAGGTASGNVHGGPAEAGPAVQPTPSAKPEGGQGGAAGAGAAEATPAASPAGDHEAAAPADGGTEAAASPAASDTAGGAKPPVSTGAGNGGAQETGATPAPAATPAPESSPAATAPADAGAEAGAGSGAEAAQKDERGFVKRVALTFDDGPDTVYTRQVLDILHEQGVKGTFFLVGKQVKLHPEMVKEMVEEGHGVGNHSMDHADFAKLDKAQIKANIEKADRLIEEASGKAPSLFRAPYGSVSDPLKQFLKESGRKLAKWNVDTRDWSGVSPEAMMETVRLQSAEGAARNGVIVLMHSFGGKGGKLDNTIEALPQVIAYFKERGYTFVTMEQMMESSNK